MQCSVVCAGRVEQCSAVNIRSELLVGRVGLLRAVASLVDTAQQQHTSQLHSTSSGSSNTHNTTGTLHSQQRQHTTRHDTININNDDNGNQLVTSISTCQQLPYSSNTTSFHTHYRQLPRA